MNLTFPAFLWLYVALFLAVVFGAWLNFVWRGRRFRQATGKVRRCPGCGKKIRVGNELVFMRCPHCGRRINLGELFGKKRH
jgi:predicted RNA-binding Zn-ribbon protein involved in translation (DUF1610 family)